MNDLITLVGSAENRRKSSVSAARELGFKVPVVVPLEGTNVDVASKMLAEAKVPQLKPASDLTDAARQVCAAV